MAKKKRSTFKANRKGKVGRGKPKGKPPAALRKKARAPRAQKPAPREVGLIDAVAEVMAVCEELAQEMRDWADGMPEWLQGGDHSTVEQAADTLEEQVSNDPFSSSDTNSWMNDKIKVTIQDPTPTRRPRSRATRLGDVRDILNDCITALEQFIGDGEGPNEDEAGQIKDELENIEAELEGVEFPGMYG